MPHQYEELTKSSTQSAWAEEQEVFSTAHVAVNRLESMVEKFVGTKASISPASAWLKFGELPEADQRAAITVMVGQAEFIRSALQNSIDSHNEVEMLKFALRKLSLLSDTNVFDEIENGDVIEIFDREYRQVYRSYSCFNLCNYSLIELTSYPFFELYERSSHVTKRLVEFCDAIINGSATYLSFSTLPEYVLRELKTQNPSSFSVREKFVSKLVCAQTGTNYVLSVKRIEEITANQEQARELNNVSFI